MFISITGATGFLGRSIADLLRNDGHRLRCLVRPQTDAAFLAKTGVEIVRGELDSMESLRSLVQGADGVVHAAAWRGGSSFSESGRLDPMEHLDKNVLSSLRLLELAREACGRFVFISSGAVYGNPTGSGILTEDSPRCPADTYGAYKAAVEVFCQAEAAQFNFNACVLRPVSILGLHQPPEQSPFYDLVRRVAAGETVEVSKGRKAVMVDDVARAVALVIGRDDVKGEIFNLSGGYVREEDIARLAAEQSHSGARIIALAQPKARHMIATTKIESLGFRFSGEKGLQSYVQNLLQCL